MIEYIYNLLNYKINHYSIGDIFWNLSLIIFTYYLFYTFKYLLFQKDNKLKSFLLILVFIAWYTFLPNTLYLLTDIRHLLDYCPRNSYLDMCAQNSWMLFVFFAYAMIGWLTFYHLTTKMLNLINKYINKHLGTFFLHFTLIIMPLGVLIGLIHRFNTWNLIHRPSHILTTLKLYFVDPIYLQQWIIYVICTYFLFYLSKYFIKDLQKDEQ